jgi:hypothetical protein
VGIAYSGSVDLLEQGRPRSLIQLSRNVGIADSSFLCYLRQVFLACNELARLSHGLFTFAAMSVKFIDDRNYSDPRGQLADLLNAPPEIDDGSPHAHLYLLYTQAMSRAFPNISSRLSERLKSILGSVVLVREPLSSFALGHLIGLIASIVREALVHFHLIIIVPEKDPPTIRLLHPSFFDFIRPDAMPESHACRGRQDPAHLSGTCVSSGNEELATKYLRNKEFIPSSEVDDLSARIETSSLPHVLGFAFGTLRRCSF